MIHKFLGKKLSVFLSTLVLCNVAIADSWTSPDKAGHLVLGAVPAYFVTTYTENPWYGFAAGATAGVAKEVFDSRNGKASGKDLVVTLIGAAAGAYAGNWMVYKQNKTVYIGYNTSF